MDTLFRRKTANYEAREVLATNINVCRVNIINAREGKLYHFFYT